MRTEEAAGVICGLCDMIKKEGVGNRYEKA